MCFSTTVLDHFALSGMYRKAPTKAFHIISLTTGVFRGGDVRFFLAIPHWKSTVMQFEDLDIRRSLGWVWKRKAGSLPPSSVSEATLAARKCWKTFKSKKGFRPPKCWRTSSGTLCINLHMREITITQRGTPRFLHPGAVGMSDGNLVPR